MMEIKEGQTYRHFKGKIVKIIKVAKLSETLEPMVVYTHDNEPWVRPYDLFVSKVDKEKYPDVLQEYRFELINND